jgi:uncharacterized 2Fe-2S/4Fe-4S cluster protein (DUF4445 family)
MANIVIHHNNQTKIFQAREGENLLTFLILSGYYITASCGGKGTCGKCKVKLIGGGINADIGGDGYFLSCQAKISGDAEIEVPHTVGSGLIKHGGALKEIDKAEGYGAAIDIGTTTLAFYLMDLKSGAEIDSYSCLNPQGVYGADVISRINACKNGNLNQLNKLIVEMVREVTENLLKKHNISRLKKITLCGNTTMMHLFAGEDPTPLGHYPFTPVFTELREYDGGYFGISADKVILLPSVSAYVGSDITAGIISTELNKGSGVTMLVDIGTNGEIALYDGKGNLYCASTAAGPAFEGANITCGMGGTDGAIDSVKYAGGKIEYTVIGGGKPKGICGSGLIDAVAVMRQYGIIDETGLMEVASGSPLAAKVIGDKFYISENVFISQKDVREFQLAKSAICAGIKTIVKTNGLDLNDVEKLNIAGGLGFYINQQNALKIGLLPPQFSGKISVAGNSAGSGAKMCLLSQKSLAEIINAAQVCKNIELSQAAEFMDEFVENMSFEYADN